MDAPTLAGAKFVVVPILGPVWVLSGRRAADGSRRPVWAISVCTGTRRLWSTHPISAKCPKDVAGRDVLIVDPMLAGGSAAEAIGEMKKRGCKHIKLMVLVAAPEGIKFLQEKHPDVDIYAGALDVAE